MGLRRITELRKTILPLTILFGLGATANAQGGLATPFLSGPDGPGADYFASHSPYPGDTSTRRPATRLYQWGRREGVYNYSPQTSAPMDPAGPAYGAERWGGHGPSGDYGPGRP
jgi:hypothetical protein